MTETQTETAAENDRPTTAEKLPRGAVAGARGFVARHGKPTRAVVERIGRRGARVVLVGTDGAMGDVMVPSVAVGERLTDAVPELSATSWDGETTAAATIGAAHRRKMAGPRPRA